MTEGKILISVDNTFEPIVKREIDAFEYDFPKARIIPRFKNESKVFADLMKDSTFFAITSRKFTPQELRHYDKGHVEAYQNELAKDAVALILNPHNQDTTFTMSDVRKLFNGKALTWQSLHPGKRKGPLNLVFDDINSSTARFMTDVGSNSSLKAKNIYALHDNVAVINYVAAHPEAIGVIGVNWISDSKDSTSLSFSKKITVAAIAPDHGEKGEGEYYKPYQAYIAQDFYPLTRHIYSLSVQGYKGLGTGFALFINGDKGQRIFLKSGLVPIHGIVRIVELK